MVFKNALVRSPGSSFPYGLSTSKHLGVPSLEKAIVQHENYISQLKKSGLNVEKLESIDDLPDSPFLEDVALIFKSCAVLTYPGAQSRVPEIRYVEDILKIKFDSLEKINSPGTLEGGDILQVGRHFFIGISSRTNREGAGQLISILKKHGYSASMIELTEFFHLKTGVSYFGNNTILVAGELVDHPDFRTFEKVIVPKEEAYCSNSLRINESFLMPSGFPKTQEKVSNLCGKMGLDLKLIDLSEFQKMDGGASCLSLRF